jgi:two-component system cell cycle sensor histidine kinase/response regulator CckA
MNTETNDKHGPAGVLRSVALSIIALGAQVAAVVWIKTSLDVGAFALTAFPPMLAGSLLGKRFGAVIGLSAILASVVLMVVFGYPLSRLLVETALGAPLVVMTGIGFGYLRDISLCSKLAHEKQKDEQDKRERLEEQLQQSQKMEAIGTLAGGVAHDINNILGIIMSSASVMMNRQNGGKRNLDLDNILSACRRGRDLTRNLLGFARKGTYIKEVIDLNELVVSSEKLFAPVIDKDITITKDLDARLHKVYGDRSQIGQALMNVCLNAAEAIDGLGTISISTWNHSTKRSRLIRHRLPTGEYAAIQISDTGRGVDEETVNHVFDPFYTTKQPGQGTGLGLSMAYGTVKTHGGGIEMEGSPGQGATVTILLPAFDTEGYRDPTPSQIISPSGKGRVLLVDDEPLILTSNKRLLEALGYKVLTAKSGARAIELYESSPYPIHLVILDFVMPEMDGAETFERLKAIDPNVNVIISSGYSKDEKIEDVLLNGAKAFIQKPFDLDQISKLLTGLSPKSRIK